MLPPGIAATETEMLETVLQYGTAKAAALGEFAAGKTGTTSNYGDAWFVGWNHKYTVAVWVGYPNGLVPMTTQFNNGPVLGGTFPALIWHDFMVSALHIDKTREEQAAAVAAARAAGKTHGPVARTSTSEEAASPAGTLVRRVPAGRRKARRTTRKAGHRRGRRRGRRRTRHGAVHARQPGSHPHSRSIHSTDSGQSNPDGKLASVQRRRWQRGGGRESRNNRWSQPDGVGRGLETWRLPATQNRHGSSTALVIPIRVPTTTG